MSIVCVSIIIHEILQKYILCIILRVLHQNERFIFLISLKGTSERKMRNE